MKKALTIFGIIAILAILRVTFVNADANQQKSVDPAEEMEKITEDHLLRGRWINKSGGFRIREDDTTTRKRYRI